MSLINDKIKNIIFIDLRIPKNLFFRKNHSLKKLKKSKTIYRVFTVSLIMLASLISGNVFGIPKPMYNKIYLWIWNRH